MTPVLQRIERRTARGAPDECWRWKGALNSQGYGVIRDADGILRLVHRVVAEAGAGPLSREAHVMHKCDNPACCNPTHLVVGDCVANMADMVAKQRSAIGTRNAFAKLDDAAVVSIRSSKLSSRQIAAVYGVAPQTIRKARAGDTWRHVPA
jgi:hypothetical protein